MEKSDKGNKDNRNNKGSKGVQQASIFLALSLLLTTLPLEPDKLNRFAPDAASRALGGALLADSGGGQESGGQIRTYTFAEVGAIAQNNGSDITRQKASLDQAEQSKDSQLSNYQSQVYQYYNNPSSGISESSLYSLQDSYESAYNSYLDAEEALEKLKPKVAYQAQKLYLDILQGEVQIEIQEKEEQRLQAEYELAKVKSAFGAYSQSQLQSAKTQWDSAKDTLENLKTTLKDNKNTMREYLNLADEVEFKLANPPDFGQYAKEFDEEDVLAEALKNSLSLKQAQREVDELSKKIESYENRGQYSQAEKLAASGAAKDLALKETKQTLTRTVESAMKEFKGLDEALEKAKEKRDQAQRDHMTAQMKMNMGAITLSELRTAEKNLLTAQKDYVQAQYNGYLGAKKVILLQQGILV